MTQQTAPATAEANGGAPPDDLAGTGSLAAKLARIMGALDRITRDGKVSGSGGYSYASADALSDILRPALAAEGVVMIPADVEVIDQRIDEIDKGTYTQTRYTVALRVGWTLTDGETTLTMATVGTGVDYSGKAANAAHTFARVNALKSAFHVSTGEDDEKVQHTGGSGSGGGPSEWTGELPSVDPGVGVTGDLMLGQDGSVGIFFKAEDKGVFETIKTSVKGIPDRRWNVDVKRWIVPAEQAGAAVVLARHLGLTIPDALDTRFPVEPAPAAPAAPGPGESPEDRAAYDAAWDASASATPPPTDDDGDIPF